MKNEYRTIRRIESYASQISRLKSPRNTAKTRERNVPKKESVIPRNSTVKLHLGGFRRAIPFNNVFEPVRFKDGPLFRLPARGRRNTVASVHLHDSLSGCFTRFETLPPSCCCSLARGSLPHSPRALQGVAGRGGGGRGGRGAGPCYRLKNVCPSRRPRSRPVRHTDTHTHTHIRTRTNVYH